MIRYLLLYMHWSDSFQPVPTGSTWYRSELIGLGTGRTERFHWFRLESGWKNWRNFLLFGLYCDPKFTIGIQPVPTGSDRNLRGTAKASVGTEWEVTSFGACILRLCHIVLCVGFQFEGVSLFLLFFLFDILFALLLTHLCSRGYCWNFGVWLAWHINAAFGNDFI